VSFKHGSVYQLGTLDDAGLRVLIMRMWPRGVRKDRLDVWLKEASPSRELLDAYHHADLTWAAFEERYRAEILDERPQVLEKLQQLEQQHGVVTLLCFERIPPYEHCHRLTLLEMLEARAARP
jgi:uncharacterized protein YeaO (DUF488 family)